METVYTYGPADRPNPLDNYLFLKVMGEKGDEKQLIGFLNAVLGRSGREPGSVSEPIESLEILENKTFVKTELGGKSCILDVLAVLQDGTKVNIEVQLRNEHNMDQRSLFYWSKIYSNSLNEGEDYRELPHVIAINIVDFDFLPGDNFHTCFHLREDADPSLVLSPVLEIHFVNMVKWRRRQRGKDLTDPLTRWLIWLNEKSPPELIAEVASMDSAIMTAYQKFGFATQEDFETWDYQRRREKWEWDMVSSRNNARREGREEGLQEGRQEGRQEGLQEGRQEGLQEGLQEGRQEGREEGRQEGRQEGLQQAQVEIARKLLAQGSTVEFVREITGLDAEVIARL